jgi:hypothetical protein
MFCTQPSPDGSWRIGVSEDSIDFTRTGVGGMAFTPESRGWRARAGWFVFIENKSRAWAYDGGSQIYLQVFTAAGENNNFGGALYVGTFFDESSSGNNPHKAFFESNFPCPVPVEVASHLPERKQKEIQAQE